MPPVGAGARCQRTTWEETTVLPRRVASGGPKLRRRPIGKVSRNDVMVALGSVSVRCPPTLALGRLTPLEERFGFALCS